LEGNVEVEGLADRRLSLSEGHLAWCCGFCYVYNIVLGLLLESSLGIYNYKQDVAVDETTIPILVELACLSPVFRKRTFADNLSPILKMLFQDKTYLLKVKVCIAKLSKVINKVQVRKDVE